MGYLHISNLYKDQRILQFRRCYALEKVHGTSAHVSWDGGKLTFFSGGESHARFVQLFDPEKLSAAFVALGHQKVTVYGEAYGGKQQGMRETYGPELRFIVFDVQVGETWLSVPDMDQVGKALGQEVVPWVEISTDLDVLDAHRDLPSEVAVRRGIKEPKPREGDVLRPLFEVRLSNGERLIAKHKGAAFEERAHPPKVADAAKLAVLTDAAAIATEWVTPMRLSHVLDKIPTPHGIELTPKVIAAMVEDVYREAAGEIVESKDVKAAIGRRAAELFKMRLKSGLG
jgi:hypothetical protein